MIQLPVVMLDGILYAIVKEVGDIIHLWKIVEGKLEEGKKVEVIVDINDTPLRATDLMIWY